MSAALPFALAVALLCDEEADVLEPDPEPDVVPDAAEAEALEAAAEAVEIAAATEPDGDTVPLDGAPVAVDEAPAAQVAAVGRFFTPCPSQRASAKSIVAGQSVSHYVCTRRAYMQTDIDLLF